MPNDITYEQLCTVLAAEEKRWQAADNTFGIPEEEYTFYKDPTPWAPTYLTLMWLTGGRCSEVASIRGRDINVIEQDGNWDSGDPFLSMQRSYEYLAGERFLR